MALSTNWQQNVGVIWTEVSSLITNLRTLDVKNLTVRDALTLIGLCVTGMKSLYMGWQVFGAFKEYGVARMLKPNLVDKYGKWALVTSDESTLGDAYMTELAQCGMNLLLVAVSPERIRPHACYLEEKYKVKCEIADIDFTDCKSVYDQIAEHVDDKEIGILVNNINISPEFPDYFTEIPVENLRGQLHGNIIASTLMCHMVLPGMLERGRGAVVMIASMASGSPVPHLAVYGACKSYLEYFAESLNQEYKDQGITVQTLLPFLVANNKMNIASLESPNLLIPSPESYAHSAVRTLGWSSKTSGCLTHTIQGWFAGIFPEWMISYGLNMLVSLFRKQAMDRLGIDDKSPMAKASSSMFDTSFMAPPSLLGILGNSG